jgi:tetratricopeptide (TPR) repeat protein
MKIRLRWVILFFVAVVLSGLYFIPTNAEYVRLAIESHEYDLAERLLKPYLSRPDPPSWALVDGARVEIHRGFPDRAALYLERLLARHPDDTKDRLKLARLYLNMNEPRRALLHYARLSESGILSRSVFRETVRLNDFLNRSQSVIDLYHRMLSLRPGDQTLWRDLIKYDRAVGNLGDEKENLIKLSEANPHREDYLRELISLCYAMGDYDAAVRYIRKLADLHGNVDDSIEAGVRSFLHLGDPIPGFLLYLRLKDGVVSADALEGVAWAFYAARYKTLSLSAFRDLARRYPQNRTYHDDVVWLSDELGWYDQAREALIAEQTLGVETPERARIRILDLDDRYRKTGMAQYDLLRWMGETRSALSVMLLYADYAQSRDRLPLARNILVRANVLYPGRPYLRETLATYYRWNNEPAEAGAVLFAMALEHGSPRQRLLEAEKDFESGDRLEPAKGVLFRVVFKDGRSDYMQDLEHLFSLYDQSSYRTGLGHLAKAASRFPGLFVQRKILIAQILVWQKKTDKARRIADDLVREYPSNRALLIRFAGWFDDLGRPDIALSYIRRMVLLNSDDPKGLEQLIHHLRWVGKEKELPKLYEALLEIDPKNAEAETYLGDREYELGQFRKAIPFFQSLVDEGKAGHREIFRLAESYRELGNQRLARKYYKTALAVLTGPVGTE